MLPAKIVFGAMEYPVFQCRGLEEEGRELAGSVDMVKSEIFVDERSGEGRFQAQTLTHEVIHIMMTQMGLEDDEYSVERWAYSILMLIKYNPELIKYLQEKLG